VNTFAEVHKRLSSEVSDSLRDYFEKLLLQGRCASIGKYSTAYRPNTCLDHTASLLVEHRGISFCKQLLKEDKMATISPNIFNSLLIKQLTLPDVSLPTV
jgi:hypothetical protein